MVGFSGAAGVRRSWVVVVMAMALIAAVLVLVASSGGAEAATAPNGKLATSVDHSRWGRLIGGVQSPS